MVTKLKTLERGDVVWVDFNPTKGHEQSGLRPAVVISPEKYNSISGMVLVCAITTKSKSYFFQVAINCLDKKSYVLCDQIRILDIKERVKSKATKLSKEESEEVMDKIRLLIN